MFLILTSFVNILVFWEVTFGQTCPVGDVQRSNDTQYFLSNNQVDANTATSICSELGGQLVSFEDSQIEQQARRLIYQKHSADLQDVWGYFNADYKNTYYATTPSPGGSWGRDNTLGMFKLYRNPTGDYRQEVRFCENYALQVGMAVATPPTNNCPPLASNVVMQLYGGTAQTDRTIPLFNYFHSLKRASRLLRNNDDFKFPFYPANVRTLAPIYLPIVHVFIGARSDFGQTGWYWSNTTNATTTDFPPTSANICRQMAIRYFDGNIGYRWEYSVQPCEGARSYYVCEVQFDAEVNSFVCDGNSLEVLWTFGKYLSETDDDFVVQVSVKKSGCTNNIFSKTVQARTAAGIPVEVRFAQVVNSTSTSNSACMIEWEHDRSEHRNITYRVVAITSQSSAEVIQRVIDFNGTSNMFNVTVDLRNFEQESNVTFKIVAASCQGESNATAVEGFCFVDASPISSPGPTDSSFRDRNFTSTVIIAVCAAVAGVLLACLAFLVIYKRWKASSTTSDVTTQSAVKYERRTTLVSGSTSASAQVSHNVFVNPDNDTPQIPVKRYLDDADAAYEIETINGSEPFPGHSLPKEKLKQNYIQKTEKKSAGFAKEFKMVVQNSAKKLHTAASLEQNAKKNRYKNIYPYDDKRVILSGSEDMDYINAAYVDGYHNKQQFIASQGPKVCTIMDFWKMIWEQNSFVIVMLCNQKEKEKVKCARYWAAAKMSKTFQDFKVHTKLEENLGGIVKRIIGLTEVATKKKRLVTQFHMTSWPDHGVPMTTSNLMNLYRMVSSASMNKPKSPIVVHCSAGAGRTGTFIGMFYLFDELNDAGSVNVQAAVIKMRESRKDMVQTLEQYVFLYKLLLERHVLPNTDMLASDLSSFSESECDKKILNEFNLLSEIPNLHTTMIADQQANTLEFDECKPYDVNIMSVKEANEPQPVVMNASYIESPNSYTMLIAARSPSKDREELFWKMILQNFVSCVIALEYQNSDSVEEAQQGDRLTFGDIVIEVGEVQQHPMFTERVLTLIKGENKTVLLHLHVTCWKATNIPPEFSVFDQLVAKMMSHFGENRGVTLIHCRNGSTRTGVFLAFMNLYDRLRSQSRIDVFRAVKDLRDLRPKMFDTPELYRYCYTLMHKAVNHLQAYENINSF